MSEALTIAGFIPARYGSTRIPGKALAEIAGMPLVVRVYRGASEAESLSRLVVLTDDRRILQAVERYGGEAVMTPESCRNGTERIATVLERIPCDIAVNIQGDEPMISGEYIDRAVQPLLLDASLDAATLACPIENREEFEDPSAVKVVMDRQGNALYFSRAAIPFNGFPQAGTDNSRLYGYKHIGLYVYRSEVVKKISSAPPTPLESAEKLEQLRLLESGCRMKVVISPGGLIGVDTPEDLEEVRKVFDKVKNS